MERYDQYKTTRASLGILSHPDAASSTGVGAERLGE